MGAIVLAAGIAFFLLYGAVLQPPPLLAPDSRTYLDWEPIRTPGYPAFLWAIQQIDSSFAILPALQFFLFVGAAAALAMACQTLWPMAWVWAGMGIALVGNPLMWRFAMIMLTESLYITLCTLFLALIVIALGRRPAGLRQVAGASLVLGLAILVRPVGYALLGAAFLLPLLWRTHWRGAMAAVLAPALVCLLAVSTWNLVTKGVFATQIFGGYNLIGHTALLVRSAPDQPYAEATRRLEDSVADIRTQLPPPQDWRFYYWMTNYGFNVAYERLLPIIEDEAGTGPGGATRAERARAANAAAWSIAMTAIAAQPGAYTAHALVHFLALWTLPAITSPQAIGRIDAALCGPGSSGAYASFCQGDRLTGVYRVPAFADGIKTAGLAILMVFSLVLSLLFVTGWLRSPLLELGAFAALCINANHSLVALVEAGLARYAVAAWPFLCVMAAIAVLLLFQFAARLSPAGRN